MRGGGEKGEQQCQNLNSAYRRVRKPHRQELHIGEGRDPFEKIGKLMRVSGKTAYNRAKDPLRLTLGEMYLLCEAKGIALEEFVSHELKLR